MVRTKKYALIWWPETGDKDIINFYKIQKKERQIGGFVTLQWQQGKEKKLTKAKLIAVDGDEKVLEKLPLSKRGVVEAASTQIFSEQVIKDKKQVSDQKKIIEEIKMSNKKKKSNEIEAEKSIFSTKNFLASRQRKRHSENNEACHIPKRPTEELKTPSNYCATPNLKTMSAMQKQLLLPPCDNQRERCSALRNPPILPRSLSTPGIPAGNTFSIHRQYSNAMTNDQQVSYPHAASPSIFHYDTRVTNTPNSLGLDGDFHDQSFYGDANLYRHSSTPTLQRRSYSSEDYKMTGMGHSARDLSAIDSPQNFQQTNSPESFYRISKSQVIHNDTLDHESYNNRGSLLDFGNHCANSGGSDFAPRSTATQAHLHEIDKHGISRLSSSEVNGSGNQQTPSVITKLDNSINFRYEQSAYENEKTDPQITDPSKIVVEKNGKTYTNLNTSQNLSDTLGHSEQNLSGPVSNKTNGIPPMEEHLLKEPESTTITAADQDIVRANSSLHADWSSRARSYALDKDGEDGNSTFQRSETDEWEDSSEEGSSSDEENSEKENIERVGRAVARCLPGPVPRAVLQYHAIFSAALKYKSEEMKSATRRQLFKSPTLPQTYYEPSDKMKEIFPGSGFYMHEHKISYMENMADDNGVFNWKILVIEVLTEIYKSNLKNYCARGQSGCGRPGICKRLYTGLYKWARSSVQKEGKVLSTKEFTAFINKSTSNRRKDSSKEKSQFSTEENSGG